jgi:hypothetical protein
MQSEDQYMERTPDLVSKIRALRGAAEKEMNRFTRIADYDVRRVVGHGPKAVPVSVETVSPSPIEERVGVPAETFTSIQTSIGPLPAPAEPGDDEEAHQ